jgi:hypothetical protein
VITPRLFIICICSLALSGRAGTAQTPTGAHDHSDEDVWDPRAASGTSWQPASTPLAGIHFRVGAWSVMLHGQASISYANSPEPRGDRQTYVTDRLGAAAARRLGRGVLEARVMASAEPLMGPQGYPLLLQTGESADGLIPLRDRQHPHDVLMELAVAYRWPIDPDVELFVYLAPVGAPAVGPTPFLHRASGRDFPSPPIGHHFEDATHTAGRAGRAVRPHRFAP